jgi:D-alanyl-lipoteichoic acid acyltransferase DltB (MBOAT superfamily)
VRRLSIELIRAVAAIALFVWLFRCDWTSVPFLIEHAVKVFGFFLALIPFTQAYTALWRLCGGRALDPMNRPLLAATPAEFWRRYNRPAQQFLRDYVYRRVPGSPLRAIVITFIVSAIVHEYVFDIAVSRVQGYQTIFFLLQGAVVAATMRFHPSGRWVWPSIAATFLFNVVSSVFFFASVQGAIPFYANGLPAWLAW